MNMKSLASFKDRQLECPWCERKNQVNSRELATRGAHVIGHVLTAFGATLFNQMSLSCAALPFHSAATVKNSLRTFYDFARKRTSSYACIHLPRVFCWNAVRFWSSFLLSPSFFVERTQLFRDLNTSGDEKREIFFLVRLEYWFGISFSLFLISFASI